MFEKGKILLHLCLVFLSVGVLSFPLVGVGLWYVLAVAELTYVSEFLKAPAFIVPFSLWVGGITAMFLLCLIIKCPKCSKRALLITSSVHKYKNRNMVFWFLRSKPPVVRCEHCANIYGT